MYDAHFVLAGNESGENLNPFQMFTPGSKLSFSQITEKTYKGFTSISKGALTPLASFNPFSSDARLLKGFVDSNDYLDIATINIVVPPGFKGDLLTYTQLLKRMFDIVAKLDEDVLAPVQDAVTQTIGSNKEMGVATIDRYRHKVLFHTNEITEFKTNLQSHFVVGDTNETIRFSKAFTRLRDYVMFNEELDKMGRVLKDSSTAKIAKRVQEISETANLLNMRLKQGKLEHLRDAQAEFVTSLLIQAATEVEFYAALVTMIQQLFSVRENINSHLNRITA